jgi:hypothetical protein
VAVTVEVFPRADGEHTHHRLLRSSAAATRPGGRYGGPKGG